MRGLPLQENLWCRISTLFYSLHYFFSCPFCISSCEWHNFVHVTDMADIWTEFSFLMIWKLHNPIQVWSRSVSILMKEIKHPSTIRKKWREKNLEHKMSISYRIRTQLYCIDMTIVIVKGYSGIGKATLFVLDVHKCNADRVFDLIIIIRRDYALVIHC